MVNPACAACSALASMKAVHYADAIAGLIANGSVHVKVAAATALGEMEVKLLDVVLPLLDAPESIVRATACVALGRMSASDPDGEVAARVAQLLGDQNPVVRAAAAGALGRMGDEGANFTDSLLELFDSKASDKSAAVQIAAVRAIGGLGAKGTNYAQHVSRGLYTDAPEMRVAAIESLTEMGTKGFAFADEVAEFAQDEDDHVRRAVADMLAKMGSTWEDDYVETLNNLKADACPAVAAAATKGSTLE